MKTPGEAEARLLAITDPERLQEVLKVMLDENEFLLPTGYGRSQRSIASILMYCE